MALLFASAASILPRCIEFGGETDFIVNEYIKKKSETEDENVRHIAWMEAINKIKSNGAWHSGLLTIKIFGDGVIVFRAGQMLYKWLSSLFLFVRQLCTQPREELIAQCSTIKNQVLDFLKKLSEVNLLVETTDKVASNTIPTTERTISSTFLHEKLSPTNLLKYLWKILNSTFSHTLQWIWIILGQTITFEMTKYSIQLCGCICYYFELLDKVWNFGFNISANQQDN